MIRGSLELESVSTCSSLGEQQRKRGWNINAGKAKCTLCCTLDIHRFIYQLCFKKAGGNYICIYIQEKQSFYKENVNSHILPCWVSPDWGLPVGCGGQQATDQAALTWRGEGKVPLPRWLPDLSFGGIRCCFDRSGDRTRRKRSRQHLPVNLKCFQHFKLTTCKFLRWNPFLCIFFAKTAFEKKSLFEHFMTLVKELGA